MQQVVDTARAMLPRIVEREPRHFLTELCVDAHESIRAIRRRYGTNPASTCTALYLTGEEAYWVHVGDSRLCHFSAGELAQIAVAYGGENCDNVSLALVRRRPEKKKAWWRF